MPYHVPHKKQMVSVRDKECREHIPFDMVGPGSNAQGVQRKHNSCTSVSSKSCFDPNK